MNLDGYKSLASQSNNCIAWLRVIREGESNQSDDAFTELYGGSHFASFDDHPRQHFPLADGRTTSAAGAWQETATTWDDFCSHFGKMAFTPENQAACALWLTDRAGALDLVIAGRLSDATARCARVWTSLSIPKRQAEAPQIFAAYGGTLATEVPKEAPQPVEAKPMAPLILPLLEVASSLIPALGKLFGSGTEVSDRNVAAASMVADALVKTTQAVNLQDAVEKIQTDPQALQAARDAVGDVLYQIGEAGGGGIKGARDGAVALAEVPLRRNTPFLVACMFYPLIAAVVFAALLDFPWLARLTNETRAMVVGFVMGTVAGSIIAFFYGTTKDSSRKTDLLAAK